MPFRNYSLTKNGQLTIGQVMSPNYDPTAGTGWAIFKDGSATFFSISIPGFSGGVKVTFASVQPGSPNVGDLWYDVSNGLLLSQWDGTDWVPFQLGTGAIAAGAVTPGLVAAGDTTNPNPFFAGGDVSNWTPFNGAVLGVTPTTGIAYPFAGEMTTPATVPFPVIGGPNFPANPGDPVQVNGWLNSNCPASLSIAFFDAADNFLGDIETDIASTGGTWQYVACVGNVPLGAASASLGWGANVASAIGTEVVLGTGLTVLTKVNGGLIESGSTITGPIISAGTIQASVFEGTNWLENSSGQFMYSGTPALGNLLLSIAPTSTTDPFGNSVTAGVWVYFSGSKIGLFNQGTSPAILCVPSSTTSTVDAGMFAFLTNTALVNEQQWNTLTSGKESGNADAAVQLVSASADNTLPAQIVIEFGGTVWATLQAATGLIADAWHNITLDSGWTSVVQPQYRRLPDGNIQVRGQATHAGVTVATNINNSNPLPATPLTYRPSAIRVYRGPASGDAAGTVAMGTGGVLQMRASGFSATQVFLDGTYSI